MGLSPYALAKIYAWRGMLLSRQFLQELASSRSLTEFIDSLKATPYSRDLQVVTQPITALSIEHALRRRLIRIHYRLMTIERRNRVLNALYSRHVSRDLKALLRGILAGMRGEALQSLVDPYAEELIGVRDMVARLFSAEDLGSALTVIKEYTGQGVAVPALGEGSDPAGLEVELDRWVVRGLLHALEKTPRSQRPIIWRLIQPIYLRFVFTAVLRAKMWGLKPLEINQVMLDTASGALSVVLPVLAGVESVEEFKRVFSVMPRGTVPRLGDVNTVNEMIYSLERGYREMLVSRARECFLRPMEGQVLPVALILLLDEEVGQLTSMAAGIEQGVSPQALLDGIIPVT